MTPQAQEAPDAHRTAAPASGAGSSTVALRAPTICVEAVERIWGDVPALNGVSLTIPPGSRIALVGPSGSGKSTLLRLLAGVLRPTRGRICVDDLDIGSLSSSALRRHRARCGIIQQSGLLVPQLTVHSNVLAGRLAHWPWYRTLLSMFATVERDGVRCLLESVGLGDRQWELASNLSGGQQQRVAVMRALASEPSILLADEPTASLDPVNATLVTRVIFEQGLRLGATVLFCTHWLELAKSKATRVIGIRNGKLVLDASPADVTEQDLTSLYAGSGERGRVHNQGG